MPEMTETFGAVALTKGKWAIIDLEDFDRIHANKWCASLKSRGTKYYAVRQSKKHEQNGGPRFEIRLHHEVLQVTPAELRERGTIVDHCDHESLDNRKVNLEECTQAVNMERSRGWKKKGVKVEDCFL